MNGDALEAVKVTRTASPRRSHDLESPTAGHPERRSTRRRTRTPKPDLPDLERTDEEFLKEWGITKQEEARRLVEFRRIIEAEAGRLNAMIDDPYLRRFLRARQHDLPRAKAMFMAHLKWRAEFGVDSILQDFHFEERDAFLTLYPQGYHKTDRLGRPVYIQHLGQINVKALAEVTTEDRMLRFHVQEYERALRYIFPACSTAAGRPISQTLAVMDVKGVGLRHLSADVKRILSSVTRTDQDNYPETLGKTLIINAPTVFRAIWAVVKPMLDTRTQAKIEVCPSDYMKVLAKWVDPANIPAYLGGQSPGSLLDDVGPWDDPAEVARIDAAIAKREATWREGGGAPLADSATSLDAAPALPTGAPLPGLTPPTGAAAVQRSESAVAEPLLSRGADSGVAADRNSKDGEQYYDALSRGLSNISSASSAYMSADEEVSDGASWSGRGAAAGGSPMSADGRRPAAVRTLPSDTFGPGSSDTDSDVATSRQQKARLPPASRKTSAVPATSQQVPILARVRALEERLAVVEGGVRRQLPAGPLPSETVGQGTLLARIAALERAMDTVLRAQEAALDAGAPAPACQEEGGSSCCGCCTVM